MMYMLHIYTCIIKTGCKCNVLLNSLVPTQEQPSPIQVPPKPTPEVTMFDPLAKDKQQPDSSTGSVSRQLYPSTAADAGQTSHHLNLVLKNKRYNIK